MSVIARFYTAFARRDWSTMGACYHDKATFSDPVFPHLDAVEARAMWKMLVTSGKDLRVTHAMLSEDAKGGTAEWDAWYTFSKTGRQVHNRISATFTFQDGLILTHREHFDFWRWSRQALGISGSLLGWSPLVKNKVRWIAADGLRKAMAR